MPDQKIHVDIKNLTDPADFQPNGITVVFRFTWNTLDARTYWHNGSGPLEDIPDNWLAESVRVHQTDVAHNTVGAQVPLESGRPAKVSFTTTEWPAGSGNATLWVLIEPL